jgi:predicted methyltransferase
LKERYPNAENLRVALIGDDDLLSAELSAEEWAKVIVVEKDPRIVSMLKDISPSSQIIESDVSDIHSNTVDNSADTFMTDPPYTLHGALSFIAAGLKFLPKNKEEKEFYVILNPTMIGRHLDTLNQILCSSGIFLKEVRPNFSQYELPDNFEEKERAAALLKAHSIDPSSLKYSSSSHLYIFSTKEPDICKLESSIDPELMYTHYL